MFAKMASDMMIKPGPSPVFGSPQDFGLIHQTGSEELTEATFVDLDSSPTLSGSQR